MRWLVIALSLATLGTQAQTQKPWSDDTLGLSLTLPDDSWQVRDASQGGPRTFLFSSPQAPGLRFMILVLPVSAAPGGLLWRETQLRAGGPNYERILYDDGTSATAARVAGQAAEVLEYRRAGVSRMLGQRRGESYLILEIGAPPALWEQPATKQTLERILNSLEVKGPIRLALAEADLSTPEQVRSRRAAAVARPSRDIEVIKHTIRAELDPSAQTLRVTDRMRVRATQGSIRSIALATGVVRVRDITGPAGVRWNEEPLGQEQFRLRIEWDRPLNEGEEQELIGAAVVQRLHPRHQSAAVRRDQHPWAGAGAFQLVVARPLVPHRRGQRCRGGHHVCRARELHGRDGRTVDRRRDDVRAGASFTTPLISASRGSCPSGSPWPATCPAVVSRREACRSKSTVTPVKRNWSSSGCSSPSRAPTCSNG